MVRWLDPRGLAIIGVEAMLSGIFGKYADKRELEANLPMGVPHSFLDRSEVWIDYVADTGDGWDTTASVAWAACHDTTVERDGVETKSGDCLVFGGDEVYPSAKPERYRQRLVAPYRAASADHSGQDPRELVAIPGNHDWYDGLTSFLRLFIRRDGFLGWHLPQTRSYFAVQLPHRWWLLGIDIAFDRYVDTAQIDYFRSLLLPEDTEPSDMPSRIGPQDKIILCTGKPSWVFGGLRGSRRLKKREKHSTALQEFEYEITRGWKCRLPLVLSGDLHHYSRYSTGKRQRLTVGGGGAFLYPTHGLKTDTQWDPSPSVDPDQQLPLEQLHLEERYPSERESEKLTKYTLVAPFRNHWFLVLAGSLAVLLATQIRASLQLADRSTVQSLFEASYLNVLASFFTQPMAGLLVALIAGGLIAFADASKWWTRILAGLLHTGSQLLGAAFAINTAFEVLERVSGFPPEGDLSDSTKVAAMLVVGVVIMIVGALIGGVVMGSYFFIAQLLGAHANEAYAALRLERHKSFLRMLIDGKGDLWLFPMKIDRPCKRWLSDDGGAPRPLDPILPRKIEDEPVRISGDAEPGSPTATS